MTVDYQTNEGLLVARKSNRGGKREGSGRPKSERDDIAVKIDRAIVAQAHYVARVRGLSLAEYLSESLRATVKKDFDHEGRLSSERTEDPK